MNRIVTIATSVVCFAPVCMGDLPDELVDSLQESAGKLTPVQMSWTYRAQPLVTEQRLASDYGVTDFAAFRADRETVATLDEVRLSQKTKTPQTGVDGQIQFSMMEKTFDGQYWYSGTGVDNVVAIGANPVLTVERLSDLRQNIKGRLFGFDYFASAGFRVAQTADELGSAPLSEILRQPRDSLTMSTEFENGQELTKISAMTGSSTLVWWLLSERAYTVLRSEERDKTGQLIQRTENSDFVQLGHRNVWLPKKFDRFWYQWRGNGPVASEPVVVEEYRVTKLTSDPIAPEEFVLNYDDAPGTFMSNAKLADERKSEESKLEYRVPAKQEDLDRVIEDAALGKNYRKPKPLIPRSVFVVAGVAAVVIATWLMMRRSRS